jgi:thioesterase domain-containing protein
MQNIYFISQEAKAIVPSGPYILIGYSAGIFPAIEMALKMNPKGEVF